MLSNSVVDVVSLLVVFVIDVDEVVLINVRSSSSLPSQPARKTEVNTTTATRRINSFFNSYTPYIIRVRNLLLPDKKKLFSLFFTIYLKNVLMISFKYVNIFLYLYRRDMIFNEVSHSVTALFRTRRYGSGF